MKSEVKESYLSENRAPPVPKWIRPVLYTQCTLAIVLIAAGIGHITTKGYLANIGTGIYSGIVEVLAALCQFYVLHNIDVATETRTVLGLCKFAVAFALILCAVDVPLIAVLSIIMGDANGYPHKSCRYYGPISDFSCIIVTQAPNVGALLCDVILLLAGLASGCLLAACGTYFLPLTLIYNPNVYAV